MQIDGSNNDRLIVLVDIAGTEYFDKVRLGERKNVRNSRQYFDSATPLSIALFESFCQSMIQEMRSGIPATAQPIGFYTGLGQSPSPNSVKR
jgi:hypothetical protein